MIVLESLKRISLELDIIGIQELERLGVYTSPFWEVERCVVVPAMYLKLMEKMKSNCTRAADLLDLLRLG
jgi:hypothetical protein